MIIILNYSLKSEQAINKSHQEASDERGYEYT